MDAPTAKIIAGDCRETMRMARAGSIDAIVTDPPYGINFMGKAWDGKAIAEAVTRDASDERDHTKARGRSASMHAGEYDLTLTGNQSFQAWSESWAREAFRVLKPGGYLLSFASTRTYHRMATGIEDAGFEIRDCIVWLYGSGFPKSLDVSKAIDRAAGAEREVVGVNPNGGRTGDSKYGQVVTDGSDVLLTAPATPEAERWQGWGTALKPANEPIVVARKPLAGTVAANVLEHGTGALNVDGCRGEARGTEQTQGGYDGSAVQVAGARSPGKVYAADTGRWPANLVLDPEAACARDAQAGEAVSPFFYCPKAGTAERDAGLAHMPEASTHRYGAGVGAEGGGEDGGALGRNVHPTVKPIELMRWLVRLVTPPGGTVLDPFNGSGTTGCAAVLEGFNYVGLEREPAYIEIAEARIRFWREHPEGVPLDAATKAERERVALAEAGQGAMF